MCTIQYIATNKTKKEPIGMKFGVIVDCDINYEKIIFRTPFRFFPKIFNTLPP